MRIERCSLTPFGMLCVKRLEREWENMLHKELLSHYLIHFPLECYVTVWTDRPQQMCILRQIESPLIQHLMVHY